MAEDTGISPKFGKFKENIAKIESGGNYKAVNPDTGAAGKYQVMPENVRAWAGVSVAEFLANPDLQEAVANKVLGGYVTKYGYENAAQAWFGGEGSIGKTEGTDVNKKYTIGTYGKQAIQGLEGLSDTPQAKPAEGGGEVSSEPPSMPPVEEVDTGDPIAEAVKGISFKNMNDADENLGLTEQEKNLYLHHLANLHDEHGFQHQDQSLSTVIAHSMQGVGGQTILVPRVYGGIVLDPEEAEAAARASGLDRHPSYNSPKEAEERYNLIHNFMDQDIDDYRKDRGLPVSRGKETGMKLAQTSAPAKTGLINQQEDSAIPEGPILKQGRK